MENTIAVGSINMNTNKPEQYDGKRDCLVVNTWFHKVEEYLGLVEVSSPTMALNYSNRIMYASSFHTSTAAVWWYTIVQANRFPTYWTAFKTAVIG